MEACRVEACRAEIEIEPCAEVCGAMMGMLGCEASACEGEDEDVPIREACI